ncbi:hypothetical protein DXK94_13315 [Arthrobacter sp. RT-1]|uniref:nucleotidyltransferase family protein n=1 Tax=Arthrobacter sp. RT-1 TaxID=2292263 RepID=UPI000E1F00EF|nr:nucleotidyltransferase family protein [Arthrobacter sp. RT-1]RDV09481.1 hypothetical protein DXK94_13315 [Arthrobacter sp. RT-1]
MVSRAAESLGIRAIFVKGPASVAQGLRRSKLSSDVDVLVAAPDLRRMLHGLRERGWEERPQDADTRTYPRHAIILDHPAWPCCIDLHFRFPGMETSASACFEVMWANTAVLDLAGQEVKVPSEALGILLLALHSLRSPLNHACQQELTFLADLMHRRSLTLEVVELALATGSLAAMRPLLEDRVPESIVREWPPPSLEWRNRSIAKAPGTARLIALIQAPWQDKPKMLWSAVFRGNRASVGESYADLSLFARLGPQFARWARLCRSFPQMFRELRQLI